MLVTAASQPADRLARHAKRDVPWVELFRRPRRGRSAATTSSTSSASRGGSPGSSSPVEPATSQADKVPHLYEGSIYPAGDLFDPVCFLCPRLPDGFDLAAQDSPWVVVDGYLFKVMEYQREATADPKASSWRQAPLIVAGTFRTAPPPPPDPTSEAEHLNLTANLPLVRFGSIEDDRPLRTQEENPDEHEAYNYTLAFARHFGPDVLARHSRKEVPTADLTRPIHRDHLRELVRVEGQLKRLRAMTPTRQLRGLDPEVKSLYEAWVFPADFDGRPVCLVCTELPEGIAPGEDQTAWVRFDGWFFKKMWFESGERNSKGGNEWKPAALLLGRTFERRPPPDDDSGGLTFANTLVPGVIALAVLILSLAIGLTWWFHRADRRVRTQVEDQRLRDNPFGP